MNSVNKFILGNIKSIEMCGVLMRITSFTLVSWLGAASPFLFVWIFNSVDAIILSYCSLLKKDTPYTILNIFWVIIGIIGIVRSVGI